MSYQPKYAAAKKTPQPAPPPVREPAPRNSCLGKVRLVFFVLLGFVVIPASCFFTARLLGGIYENVGRPKMAVVSKTMDMQIQENFESTVFRRITAVKNSVRPVDLEELPEELRPTEETLPPVRKQYWIEEGTLVAPEPNQSLFGRTDDPAVMEQVLKKA